MSNFGNMVRRIRTDLNRGSSHDARIKEAICDAIVHYTPKRLAFNQKRSRTVLYSGTAFLALPTDWIEADHLRASAALRASCNGFAAISARPRRPRIALRNLF